MIIVNFSHPLTEGQLASIAAAAGASITRTCLAPAQFDDALPFAPQAAALVAGVALSPAEWQQEAILVNLPSLSVIAGLVLAELHGRMGYFPAILRLRRVAESVPPQFEFAEILNLQAARDTARHARGNIPT
jgi:hypothetical protein